MSDTATRWHRLEQIVHAALERPAGERAAFLAEACVGDEDLQREAASLVDRDDRADAFLVAPLGELAANAVTYSPDAPPDAGDSRNLVGVRLGDYEIRARIGAGGMGEVYRARDHALHRDVAIKLLPAVFAADRERLARFEREARLLASLNHPHIGAVYGLAGAGDLRGIVLELIDGETLEARLTHGPMPLAQALAIAVQIAGALDHAHQRGVMHRDLKPANIMLTKGGAKLLDFGLAKWGGQRSGYVSISGSSAARPEGVESVTDEGSILGTLHYMAPEQLEGKKVDARADVFAFGAVLYEMLAGQRAFDGGSTAAVMASVLNTEPAALDTLRRLASPALERIVRKCLAKDPDNRWQTVRDLADELKWIADEAGRPAPALVDRGARGAGLARWALLGGAALALALAGWAGWRIGSADDPPAARAIVRFPVLPSREGRIFGFDISDDGTKLVYESGGGALLLRELDQLTDVPIPGTEGGGGPFFSPDGQWVAYFSQGRLLKVNVQAAAAPILLWDRVGRWLENSAAWLDDGTIVVGRPEQGLVRLSAEGGEPQPLTSITETPHEFDHHSPSALPGNQALLFTVHAAADYAAAGRVRATVQAANDFKVVALVLATGERRVLIDGAFDARYVATGHLVFSKDRTILAVPFDVRRLEVTGPPVSLVEDVDGVAFNGGGGYRVSKSGTLVFRPAPSNAGRTLVWVDRKANESAVPIPPRAVSGPSVAPDGKHLAFAVAEGGRRDIWTYEFATGKLARVTREGDNRTPIWTRDGQRLAFASTSGGSPGLWWQSAGGGGAPEHLVSGDLEIAPGGWSADDKVLLYSDGGTGPSDSSMFSVAVDGTRQPTPVLHGPGSQRNPRVSPNGRWVAYTSAERRTEVFVSDLPNFSSHHQVSTEGGIDPQWSRNGQELVYRRGQRIFSVSVDTTRGFTSGKPQQLFLGRYAFGREMSYDVAPDGRLLMIKPDPEELASLGLRVVLNWADELPRRVPRAQ